MTSYDELPTTIGKLKRSAIDAYMRTIPGGWEIYTEDRYELSGNRVSRPGPDGEGGGDWSSNDFIIEWIVGGSRDEEFGTAFQTIRDRIDAAFAPWLDLPDPARIAPQVESCRQVTRRLSGAAAISNGAATGSGIIPGNLALILENTDAMAGTAIGAFKSKFIGQLGPAIGGHHGISVILGTALASEQGLWGAARQNVADIADSTLARCEMLADTGATGDPKLLLQVAGWAVKGVGFFATGGISTALEVAGLGLEVIKGTVGEPESVTIDGSDAEAALASLEDALRRLNDQITTEERLLDDNLTKNDGNVHADRSSYDLTLPVVAADSDTIIIQPSLMREISEVYMPAISTELNTVAASAFDITLASIDRSGELGIGWSGPSTSWYRLRYLLYELLRNLGWEVEKGAKDLDLVLEDHLHHEAEIVRELDALTEEIRAGAPSDPWD